MATENPEPGIHKPDLDELLAKTGANRFELARVASQLARIATRTRADWSQMRQPPQPNDITVRDIPLGQQPVSLALEILAAGQAPIYYKKDDTE